MGFGSVWHWIIFLVIALLVFGTGKISRIGLDFGGAIRGFKREINGDASESGGSEGTAASGQSNTAAKAEKSKKSIG